MDDERDTGTGERDPRGTGTGRLDTEGALDAEGGRDVRIADLLRSVAVPDHAPGYWEELDARLAAEEDAYGPAHGEHAKSVAHVDRAPRRRLWDVRARLRPARVLAAAALVCVLALVALVLPRLGRVQPQPASAADVVTRAVKAIDGIETLSGVIVRREALGGDPRGRVVETSTRVWMDATGNWAERSLVKGPDAWGEGARTLAFDAAGARLTEVKEWTGAGTPTYTVWTNAPVGAPDGAAAPALRFRAFARVVGALRGADLSDGSCDGRPAWRLTAARRAGERWPRQADAIELLVDEATALPVRWALYRAGRVVAEQRLDDLTVNKPIDETRFVPPTPASAETRTYDAGYRRLAPADIAAALPFAAYAPRAVPAGFAPQSAALARREWRDPAAGAQWEALAVPAALLSWRRGFDELSVSTRPYARSVVYQGEGRAPRVVEDPFETTYAWLLMRIQPRVVTLRAGALSGLPAHVVAGAWAYPHLWIVVPASVAGEKVVVTVAGDATADELVAVAESLAPLTAPVD